MVALPDTHAEFEEFYLSYRSLVYAIAMRLLHDRSEAQDVVQQVFLTAWSRSGAFHGGNIASWLTVVARNAALDRLRQNKRCRWIGDDRLARAAATEDPQESAIALISYAAVLRALGSLDGPRRTAVWESFIEDRSHTMIARRGNVPLGTVKTRIRSGIRELRKALG